jgi:hydroxymethylbilane synthase
MPTDLLLPAVAQGIVGVQGVKGSGATELARAITHDDTHARARSERSLLAAVAGGCVVPLAGFSELGGDRLTLRARLAHPEEGPLLQAEASGAVSEAEEIGRRVGQDLLAQGGAEIVAAAKALAREG